MGWIAPAARTCRSLANALRVRPARPLGGRAPMSSTRHAAIGACASARLTHQLAFRHASRRRPLTRSAKACCVGVPGSMQSRNTPVAWAHWASNGPANAGPLSQRIDTGSPRVRARRSSTRTTRAPGCVKSTARTGHSRVQSSTRVSARIVRPLPRALASARWPASARAAASAARRRAAVSGDAPRALPRGRVAARASECRPSRHGTAGRRVVGSPTVAAASPTMCGARGVRSAVSGGADPAAWCAPTRCSGTRGVRILRRSSCAGDRRPPVRGGPHGVPSRPVTTWRFNAWSATIRLSCRSPPRVPAAAWPRPPAARRPSASSGAPWCPEGHAAGTAPCPWPRPRAPAARRRSGAPRRSAAPCSGCSCASSCSMRTKRSA